MKLKNKLLNENFKMETKASDLNWFYSIITYTFGYSLHILLLHLPEFLISMYYSVGKSFW